jgi:hypothetical protein
LSFQKNVDAQAQRFATVRMKQTLEMMKTSDAVAVIRVPINALQTFS